MPVHIERLTSQVSVQDADLGLTPQQIERIVALVIARLEDRAREAQRANTATQLRRQAAAPFDAGR